MAWIGAWESDRPRRRDAGRGRRARCDRAAALSTVLPFKKGVSGLASRPRTRRIGRAAPPRPVGVRGGLGRCLKFPFARSRPPGGYKPIGIWPGQDGQTLGRTGRAAAPSGLHRGGQLHPPMVVADALGTPPPSGWMRTWISKSERPPTGRWCASDCACPTMRPLLLRRLMHWGGRLYFCWLAAFSGAWWRWFLPV